MSRNMKTVIAIAAIFILLPFSAFARTKAEAEEPISTEPTGGEPAGKYNEAPQLKELVKQDKLPPVEDRLPKEPMVVQVDEIGVYGGELYYPTKSIFEHDIWIRESLCLYEKGTIKIGPGLARTWDVSSDGTEYTFYLREGHKWSDGHPLRRMTSSFGTMT